MHVFGRWLWGKRPSFQWALQILAVDERQACNLNAFLLTLRLAGAHNWSIDVTSKSKVIIFRKASIFSVYCYSELKFASFLYSPFCYSFLSWIFTIINSFHWYSTSNTVNSAEFYKCNMTEWGHSFRVEKKKACTTFYFLLGTLVILNQCLIHYICPEYCFFPKSSFFNECPLWIFYSMKMIFTINSWSKEHFCFHAHISYLYNRQLSIPKDLTLVASKALC